MPLHMPQLLTRIASNIMLTSPGTGLILRQLVNSLQHLSQNLVISTRGSCVLNSRYRFGLLGKGHSDGLTYHLELGSKSNSLIQCFWMWQTDMLPHLCIRKSLHKLVPYKLLPPLMTQSRECSNHKSTQCIAIFKKGLIFPFDSTSEFSFFKTLLVPQA